MQDLFVAFGSASAKLAPIRCGQRVIDGSELSRQKPHDGEFRCVSVENQPVSRFIADHVHVILRKDAFERLLDEIDDRDTLAGENGLVFHDEW